MSDTSYPTMTQQHFSTDPMLTNTIENRQFGTMGEWKIFFIFLSFNGIVQFVEKFAPGQKKL